MDNKLFMSSCSAYSCPYQPSDTDLKPLGNSCEFPNYILPFIYHIYFGNIMKLFLISLILAIAFTFKATAHSESSVTARECVDSGRTPMCCKHDMGQEHHDCVEWNDPAWGPHPLLGGCDDGGHYHYGPKCCNWDNRIKQWACHNKITKVESEENQRTFREIDQYNQPSQDYSEPAPGDFDF